MLYGKEQLTAEEILFTSFVSLIVKASGTAW